mgnify:CR=1 FL=1|jgi:hypothetical protein
MELIQPSADIRSAQSDTVFIPVMGVYSGGV